MAIEPVRTDDSSLQLFKEETVDGAVYNVYLKKVRYHTSPDGTNARDPVEDKKAHLQWRLEEVKVIKSGTLERLVEAICSDTGDLDATYVNMFLATYRSYTCSSVLVYQILKRYRDVGDYRMSQKVRESCRRSIRTLLLVWLDSYTEDFREPPTYPTLSVLHNFAVSSMPDSELAQKTGDWLITFRREEELTNSVCEPVHDLATILRHSVVEAARSASLRNGCLSPPVDMLSISDKLFAEQLTYVDAELFKKVIPHHCLGSVWSRRADKKCDTQPLTVYATVDQFNSVSYRVIAMVLKPQYSSVQDRAAIIDKWIRVAQECRILKNFSSLKAIVAGLQSTSVFRLKKVWQHISRERMACFEELADIFCEENNQSILRDLLNKEGTAKFANPETNNTLRVGTNFLGVQTLTRSKKLGQCDSPSNTTMQGTVPYLGLFLTDLTMIDTAFRDCLADGVINFDKKRREYQILAQIQMLQSTAGLYRIEPDSIFFDWFYRLRIYDENESYELSHVIEPSINCATVADRRGHMKNASLGFFAPRRPASMEDIRFVNTANITCTSLYTKNEPDDDDAQSVFSMTDYYINNRREIPKFRHCLSLTSVLSSTDSPPQLSLLPTYCSTPSGNDSVPVKVFLLASENHCTNNYKSILLSHNDHVSTVLRNTLTKYNLAGKIEDFCIVQQLPDGSELQLPTRGNVFYAIKRDVPDVRFIVRHRSEWEKLKFKNVKEKSRLRNLIF